MPAAQRRLRRDSLARPPHAFARSRRLCRLGGGAPAHHLLDPASGRPAFTGVVQATALAPSALLAELYAKAALLSGPRRGARWLSGGGLIMLEDGSYELIEPAAEGTPPNTLSLRLASSPPPRPKEAASASVSSSAGSGRENR